jgi:hypothetical protein
MDEIWTVLENATFPATKAELISHAIASDSRHGLVERLEALPQDRYESADELGLALSRSRAESNPAMVAITAKPCENCGFPIVPGEPHSCIEEKARFAESVQKVTDEFEIIDDGGTS